MSSSLLFAELAATCNALGYFDGNKYYIDPQCQETLKDLIRFLRHDDENHEIRRYLGEANILQSDLLPILKQYSDRTEIFEVLLRLLVNLTNPALLLYREELPADKTSRNYYLQIIQHLQSYKEAFADDTVWAILCKKLGELLKLEWEERGEEKGLIIERILVLIRNVLHVPTDIEGEKRLDNDANIHDQVIWSLHCSGLTDLLLYIASSENEQQYYMHVLEIVSLMLREQSPTMLAQSAATRSISEKERDEKELLTVRQKETQLRQQKAKKFIGTRFTGTYVLKDVKSIGKEDMIYHKPVSSLSNIDFNHDKKKMKRPKNRLPMKDGTFERRSTLSIRLLLKEFCIEFLNGAYNTFMHQVKEDLVRAKAQSNDESYYLWAMKFFMEFNRNYKFEMKLVSETMSLQSFHFVQTQLETYYEMMTSDKKKIHLWSRRMHIALRAYQELLMTLIAMDKSGDPSVQESAKVIKNNIFYVIEYRELILTLMLNYNEQKMSRGYLKDLLETTHIFLKMLENFCSRSRGIVVQQKRKVRTHKKKKSNPGASQSAARQTEQELWIEFELQITAILETPENIPEDVVPFDPASDIPISDQKIDAVTKIKVSLKERRFAEAIALLRASREVWPENDSFGAPNPAPEEELLALRDIYMASLDVPETNTELQNEERDEEENEEDEEDDDEAERAARIAVSEQTFQFIDFAKRFVQPRVIQSCGLILKQFEQNTPHTNHCALKLLHRIAVDCKMPAMMFQATLFRTFQRILDASEPQYKELQTFAIFIVRKFVEVARVNSKVYMELLFWKSSRDAYDIENGYGSYQVQTSSGKQAWSEEEEDELRRLYEEFMSKPEVGGDVVDWIMENMINKDRSRRGVMKKMKELGFPVNAKTKTKTSKEWSSEEVEQLTTLFEQFKEGYDPLGCIMDRLTVRRPKPRIIEKLLELGLISDRKELHKKRGARKSRGAAGGDNMWGDTDDDGSVRDSDSGNESDASDASIPRPRKATRPTQQPKPRKTSQPKSKPKKPIKQAKSFSSAEATRLLKEVIAAGMAEAVKWIGESIEEAAEDLEQDPDDSEEGVPLLPLSVEAIQAMDTPLFQNMLRSLGLTAPADEQEIYWRIPPALTSVDLRSRKAILDQVIAGEDSNIDDPEPHTADTHEDSSSHDHQDLGDTEDIENQSELPDSLHQENSVSVIPSDEGVTSSKKKKRTVIMDDSESDDEGIVQVNGSVELSEEIQIQRNSIDSESHEGQENGFESSSNPVSKRKFIDSDSEDETVEGSTNDAPRKRLISSDSESETPNVKTRKVFISDDDD